MTMTESVDLSQKEIQRYSRHLIMPEVGIEGQKKLKAAKILCVGAGGLGSPRWASSHRWSVGVEASGRLRTLAPGGGIPRLPGGVEVAAVLDGEGLRVLGHSRGRRGLLRRSRAPSAEFRTGESTFVSAFTGGRWVLA